MTRRGLFIVIEGMDNVGKTTFVENYLQKYPLTQRVKLPTPEIYSLIEQCSPDQWHDIFHENIESASKKINEYLNNGLNVICDRYIYSHFVYEALTSTIICQFKFDLKPDAIVYFVHNDPKRLPKKDTMEKIVDYEEGQRLFERMFRRVSVPVVHVLA